MNLDITSTLSYGEGNPVVEGTTVDEYTMFPDGQLVPVEIEAQAEADMKIELGVFFDTADNGSPRAFFNNITYQMPVVPSYLTAVTMGNDSLNPVVYGQTNSFILKHGDMIELYGGTCYLRELPEEAFAETDLVLNRTVINWDAGFHPFHLHGHKFQLISESFNVASDDRSINPLVPEGLANPMRRDTVMIPPDGGSRTVRFRADNPGTWL